MELKQVKINGVVYDLPKDKNFLYEQETPASVWTIQHDLGKYPSITLLDADGVIMLGDIKYVDMETVEITFATEITGKALLN
jgi:hypothetical protein